jgi:tetratricopeptide (TPR) repeat protein
LDPVTTLPALLTIIAALSYAAFAARKQPLVSFAIFWFFGNLAIESSFLALEIVFEHRTYLPSMFVVFLVVCLTDRFVTTRALKIVLWSGLALVLAIWAYERNKVWESPVTLWQDSVDKAPKRSRPHFNLAVSLMEERLSRETKADYVPDPALLQKEIFHFRETLRLNPDQLGPHNDLALSLLRTGHFDEAIQHFRFVLDRAPGNEAVIANLAQAFLSKGDIDQALQEVQLGLKSSPDSALLHNAIGVLLAKKGRIREALEHWRRAVWLQPDLAEAQNNLQKVLSPNGAVDLAIQAMEEKSRLDPAGALLFELGLLYKEKGDLKQARERFQQAIQLSPDSIGAMQQLALVYAMMGHYEDAVSVYREIIRRRPQESSPYYAIASVFSMKNETDEALVWLQKAVDKGFADWHRLDTDPNLENLRMTIEYTKWKERRMR